MLIRPRRARPIIIKSSKRDKGSIVRILQGIFVLGLGIVFIIANANTGSPYKEISGHVQNLYVKTVNGQYNSNILNINTDPQDLFVFDKNALNPPWKDKFFKGEEVDIHYLDETPKTIVAFQFYDQYGNPLTLYYFCLSAGTAKSICNQCWIFYWCRTCNRWFADFWICSLSCYQ